MSSDVTSHVSWVSLWVARASGPKAKRFQSSLADDVSAKPMSALVHCLHGGISLLKSGSRQFHGFVTDIRFGVLTFGCGFSRSRRMVQPGTKARGARRCGQANAHDELLAISCVGGRLCDTPGCAVSAYP